MVCLAGFQCSLLRLSPRVRLRVDTAEPRLESKSEVTAAVVAMAAAAAATSAGGTGTNSGTACADAGSPQQHL